jgi:hypothetical protein
MPEEDYIPIKEAVEHAGFFTTFRPDEGGEWIVLASRRTDGRLHGNSIRVSVRGGKCFLSTWVPIFYRLAVEQELPAVCLDCLRSTRSILGAIPPEIVARYQLVEVSEAEYDEA